MCVADVHTPTAEFVSNRGTVPWMAACEIGWLLMVAFDSVILLSVDMVLLREGLYRELREPTTLKA